MATDINCEGLAQTKALAQSINPDATILTEAGDVTNESTVNQLIKLAVSKFGRLDYALNIAGELSKNLIPNLHSNISNAHNRTRAGITGAQNKISLLKLEDYDAVQHINARAVWLCERAEIAQMLAQEPLPSQ